LAGASIAVSAGAIAVANTLTTLPSPREAQLHRLVEAQAVVADTKGDKLDLASLTPDDLDIAPETAPAVTAAPSPDTLPAPQAAAIAHAPSARAVKSVRDTPPAAKPHTVATKQPKPAITSVLSDSDIAALKRRLRLSADQEPYWPEIEAALRDVAHQINEANRRAHATLPVDISTPEVDRLKSAAIPFLMQMRPDQKAEIVALAHLMGMDSMVAML